MSMHAHCLTLLAYLIARAKITWHNDGSSRRADKKETVVGAKLLLSMLLGGNSIDIDEQSLASLWKDVGERCA
jgi:hypothetical protein